MSSNVMVKASSRPSVAEENKPPQPRPSTEDKISQLRAKKHEIEQGGGLQRIEKQHASGKMSARERLERLVDSGSFTFLIFGPGTVLSNSCFSRDMTST